MGDSGFWGGGSSSSSSGGSGGGGGGFWGGGSGTKSSGGGGFGLHSITNFLGSAGSAVANVGEGIGGTALDIVRSPYVLIDEATSGKNEAQRMADYNKRIPFLAALGWGGEKGGSGLTQTIGEAGGKSLLGKVQGSKVVPIGKAYSDNPFSAALNDVANVTMLAGPAAGAAGAAANATDSATLAKLAGGAQAVADAPGLPLRGAKSVLVGAAERAIESGAENPSFLARMGVKMTPAYKDMLNTVLEGRAQQRVAGDLIGKSGDTASAIEALRGRGFNVPADAIDAASHTAPLPEEVAARPVAAPRAETVPPPPTVSGKELTTALHNAGFHAEANGLAPAVRQAAEMPRGDVAAMLHRQGLGPAADVLTAARPAERTGTDLIAGLEGMARTKAGVPPPFSNEAVPLSVDQMQREASGAIRSATGAKLGESPAVVASDIGKGNKGYQPLGVVTQGKLPAEGYLPNVLADRLSPQFTSPKNVAPTAQGLLSGLDPINHAYVQAKIGLNPATLMGRLGGHTSLVGLNAPHPLDSLLSAVKVFTGKVNPEDTAALAEAPARLSKGAVLPANATQMAEDVAGKSGVLSRATSKLDTLAQKSPITRWAAKMDDALRKGVYLAETKAGAGAEDALQTVNRVAGEFDALSPAEQAIARRAVPFYNWHKQIALIATHLAEDNPAKAAMLTHLGDTGIQLGHQPGGTPGELQIAGHAISPDFMVPFGEAGTTFKVGGAPSLGPVPKAAFGALLGTNPNTGKPFSGPKQRQGQDYRYEGVLQNLRKSIPQMGLLDNLRGYNNVARYNNGSPVVSGGHPIDTKMSPTDAALTFGGLRSENLQSAQSRSAAVAAKAKGGTSKKKASGFWG